jgi:hypothetical protein
MMNLMMMTNFITIFDEPELEFRYGQRVPDPHDGLVLFGPFDADDESNPKSISYIVIGTDSGISLFSAWSRALMQPAALDIFKVQKPEKKRSDFRKKKPDFRLWPPYPGFEAAFCTRWPSQALKSYSLDPEKLSDAARLYEKYERAYKVSDFYLDQLEIAANKLEPNPELAICIVPDEVYSNCRPESRITNSTGEKTSQKDVRVRKSGQLELFSSINSEIYSFSPNFRRQIKARSMKHGIPIQIIRESTLRLTNENEFGQRPLTPLSDRMWNLGTALYYKAGGKPWRLVTAREGTCYIGIAFRKTDEDKEKRTACCAAQMFLDTGDGIVFLGEFGPWYSPVDKQFRLTKEAASNLLKGALKTYSELDGKELNEIFLHSRSSISNEEFEGYQEACPSNVKLVGIRVRSDRRVPFRLYRPGDMPVIRGTFMKINERSGLLWASGFKPRLATYDGWEVPIPVKIDIQHGEASIERVGQDILGLTKLNYNACRLGDSQPVTVGFSDAVGEILVSNPTVKERRYNFKFYI